MNELMSFVSENEQSIFRNFKIWKKSRGDLLYLFRANYSDRAYAARIMPIDGQVEYTLSLIPGLPDSDGGTGRSFFKFLNLGFNKELEPICKIHVSVFERITKTYIENTQYSYDQNGNRTQSPGSGSMPLHFGIYNYDIRKLKDELYQTGDIPEQIDFDATFSGLLANIANGDFSSPKLIGV